MHKLNISQHPCQDGDDVYTNCSLCKLSPWRKNCPDFCDCVSFDLQFSSRIRRKDVDCAMSFIKKLFEYPRAWGLKMSNVHFDSYVTEDYVAETLTIETLDRIEFDDRSELRWHIWDGYFWRQYIPDVRSLVLKSVYDADGCWCEMATKAISQLSLETLFIRKGYVGNRHQHVQKNYLRKMVCSADTSILRHLNIDAWDVQLCDIGWLCEALRSFPVLESVRFFVKDGVHLDLLDGLLRNCRGLKHITISSAEIFETDPDIVGARVGESILCHPNVEHIVGGFSMSVIHCMRNIGYVKEQMIAFGGRRIKRVSSRSSVRKLFRDADRLVWSFLM